MEQENKYYTPAIEDIRYGYEMEWLNKANESPLIMDGVSTDTWTKYDYEFQGLSVKGLKILIALNRLRVLYLTSEQIVAEGWNLIDKQPVKSRQDYQKENWLLLYSPHNKWLLIANKEDESTRGKYAGECKDINTLRYIMKLLKIQ